MHDREDGSVVAAGLTHESPSSSFSTGAKARRPVPGD